MKIGRNDPCPCGSGKKYKKCCLGKDENINNLNFDKHYFELKGKNAESFIYTLAQKSFLTDWCYMNPKWDGGKELCDLLVIFGEIAIIWQIKDLKIRRDGKYNKREVEKNLNQLIGAKRRLFELKEKISLGNPRRGNEEFDPNTIKEIYLMSALVGEEDQNYFEFIKKIKNKTIHILDRKGVEILLNELNTIHDFVGYLKETESFLSSDAKITITGGEEELLAYYLMNERSFKNLKKYGYVFIQEGCWKDLKKKPEYLSKKEEDRISYFWDDLINTVHVCGEGYEKIAQELARTHRFQRRCLSKIFLEAHKLAIENNKVNFYQRVLRDQGVTYCFVFSNAPSRESRRNLLSNICFVARNEYQENKKVMGIATEIGPLNKRSFDFCLLDFLEWTEVEEKEANRIKKEIPIFRNLKGNKFHEDEYPNKPKFL